MNDAQMVLAKSMTEKALSQHVVNLARMLGWRVARWPTWRATGTDPGVPDLVCARDGRAVFFELKREDGKLSDAQYEWIKALGDNMGRAEVYVVRPSDWLAGKVDTVLRTEAART